VTGEPPARKRLVLDANILLRAALGVRVLELLETYEDSVDFFAPQVCFSDARRHITALASKRHFDPELAFRLLDRLPEFVEPVEHSLYGGYEESALQRIASRDPDDWPIVATALLLDCPIWTEDQDFFGSGVATWITATVEVYLRDAS